MTTLKIIVASTRPGRVGLPIGQWTHGQAVAHGGFTKVELLDLAEVNLPFMNEPNHPRAQQYVHQHTRDWSATIAEADALVFVMPEYNHGYNAELKNAIDYLFNEWSHKAVGLVSYGAVAGGTRAVQQIKQVVTAVKMTPIVESVVAPFGFNLIDAEGKVAADEAMTGAAKAMFDEIVRVDAALRPLREGAAA
ncbi:NAD(P)H-dependent oxidoreductase [Streptomyces sp. PA03-1a]|nr:NAD(P)H-dependent oxidoreductase [Streptomyces sp. PA03-1a]MDX2816546.1 NAD(P)H-dependent oxidoreductase [Streptomyces sp. PA03-5A]